MHTVSKSPRETQDIAADLARKVVGTKGPVIITLKGNLGAGKTTFVQGFIRALGIKARVKSPTFLLIKHYVLAKKGKNVYHVDCYRVMKWQELKPLDIAHILQDPRNIVLIEWPEKIKKILPKKHISVQLGHHSPSRRSISIS